MGMYSLKVWAGCIVFGSILLALTELIRDNIDGNDVGGILVLAIIFGFYFSIPAFLFFWLFAFVLQFYIKNKLQRRIVFSLEIPIMIVLTRSVLLKERVALFDWNFWTDPMICYYVISGIVMVWLTSLPRHP